MNFNNIFKQIEKILYEEINSDQSMIQFAGGLQEDLIQVLISDEAQSSYIAINELFRKNKIVDENGKLLQVADPKTIVNQIYVTNDGNVKIDLSESQRRFLAADKIYGLDLFGKFNIKYTDERVN